MNIDSKMKFPDFEVAKINFKSGFHVNRGCLIWMLCKDEGAGEELHRYVTSYGEPKPWCEGFLVLDEMYDCADGTGKDNDGAPQSQRTGFGETEAGHVQNDLRGRDCCEDTALDHEHNASGLNSLVFARREDTKHGHQDEVDEDDTDQFHETADRVFRSGISFRQDTGKTAEHVAALRDIEGEIYDDEESQDHVGKKVWQESQMLRFTDFCFHETILIRTVPTDTILK